MKPSETSSFHILSFSSKSQHILSFIIIILIIQPRVMLPTADLSPATPHFPQFPDKQLYDLRLLIFLPRISTNQLSISGGCCRLLLRWWDRWMIMLWLAQQYPTIHRTWCSLSYCCLHALNLYYTTQHN